MKFLKYKNKNHYNLLYKEIWWDGKEEEVKFQIPDIVIGILEH